MEITGIEVIPFETLVHRFSNGDPYRKQRVLQTLTKIATDEGADPRRLDCPPSLGHKPDRCTARKRHRCHEDGCSRRGIRCAVRPHMSGFGNLQVLGATGEDVCEYYERGLLAPGVDYGATPGCLKAASDTMDPDGFVTVPTGPGLGYDIVWDYIEEHRIPDAGLAVVCP